MEQRTSRAIFDSDSFDILLDRGATSWLFNSLKDFVNLPKNSNILVKGLNGNTTPTKVGTAVIL